MLFVVTCQKKDDHLGVQYEDCPHGQYQFKTHLFGLDFKRLNTLGTPYNEHAKYILDRHRTNQHEKFGPSYY